MIYFDNAATGYPKPKQVYKTVLKTMRKYGGNAGRGGHKRAVQAAALIYNTREELAKLFNIDEPERIAFTQNATEALNFGLKAVLSEGDEVIISSMEHNSVLRPLRESDKYKVVIARAGRDGILSSSALEELISERTKLISITHASNVCGAINDIAKMGEIAKRHNVLFMVDAAQSAGLLPVDVKKMNIDILCFAGHKALMGPQGTGGIYISNSIYPKTIIEGGTGSESENQYQPESMPERLESGTLNTPAIAGLGEGVKLINRIGTEEILMHERELSSVFVEGVGNIEGIGIIGYTKNGTGVVSIVPEGIDCVEFAQILDTEYDIAVRAGLHCSPLAHETLSTLKSGTVRFSFSLFSTKHEVKKAVSAINKIMKQKIKK